ncbi:MAG: hypothetical protein GF329_12455 [Candidatus Lokiarchaeota archaeon]|nr:hypothetical protein [Candidatus Lokiarchaeota archaeon]
MVKKHKIEELRNLIKNGKLQNAFDLVKQLYRQQTELIVGFPEGSMKSASYYKLMDEICRKNNIPIKKDHHYVRNVSVPLVSVAGAGLILALSSFFVIPLMMIGLIIFIVGWVGFAISLPICIAMNLSKKIKKPGSYIVKINGFVNKIENLRDMYTEFQIERLKLDMIKMYWYWIVSANKYGYSIPEGFYI